MKDKNKEEKISDMAQYAREKKGEFEKLRRDIQERDLRRSAAAQGRGAESAIQVD